MGKEGGEGKGIALGRIRRRYSRASYFLLEGKLTILCRGGVKKSDSEERTVNRENCRGRRGKKKLPRPRILVHATSPGTGIFSGGKSMN